MDSSEPPLPFCRVVCSQLFPAQYAHACPPSYVPPPHSSSRVSAAILIRRFKPPSASFLLSQSSRLSTAYLLISAASPPTVVPRVSARNAPSSILSPSSPRSRSRAHFSLPVRGCRHLSPQYLFCRFIFAQTLSLASLRGNRRLMWPSGARSRIRSAGAVYRIRTAVSTKVRSTSCRTARSTPSSLHRPIVYTSLLHPSPSLVAPHLRRVSDSVLDSYEEQEF